MLFKDTSIFLLKSVYPHQRQNEVNEDDCVLTVAKEWNVSEERRHIWDLVGEINMLALRNDGGNSYNQIQEISHFAGHKSCEVSVFFSRNM